MTDEEKIKFLKKMGYSGSCLQKNSIVPIPKPEKDADKKMPKNHVDKSELLNLHRMFNEKSDNKK